MTALASWTSHTPAIATVTPGLVRGVSPGTASITASVGALTAEAVATVTPGPQSLTLDPPRATLPTGRGIQLVATALLPGEVERALTYEAMWTTSDPSIASVSPHGGFVRALSAGQVSITATIDAVEATATLVITPPIVETLWITCPINPSVDFSVHVVAGQDVQLTATARFSDRAVVDVTSQVAWSSSNPAALSVSTSGMLHAIQFGIGDIQATLEGVGAGLEFNVQPAEAP